MSWVPTDQGCSLEGATYGFGRALIGGVAARDSRCGGLGDAVPRHESDTAATNAATNGPAISTRFRRCPLAVAIRTLSTFLCAANDERSPRSRPPSHSLDPTLLPISPTSNSASTRTLSTLEPSPGPSPGHETTGAFWFCRAQRDSTRRRFTRERRSSEWRGTRHRQAPAHLRR